jgi:hypothetical protein
MLKHFFLSTTGTIVKTRELGASLYQEYLQMSSSPLHLLGSQDAGSHASQGNLTSKRDDLSNGLTSQVQKPASS